MSCLGCFDRHTDPAAALACYYLASPDRVGRLSTAPNYPETGADSGGTGANSAEKGPDPVALPAKAIGRPPRPENRPERLLGLRVACRRHSTWRLACPDCHPDAG